MSYLEEKQLLLRQVIDLLFQLDDLWWRVSDKVQPDFDFLDYTRPDYEDFIFDVHFPDPRAAMTVALYSSLMINAYDILGDVSDDHEVVEIGLKTHCASILAAAYYLQSLKPGVLGSFTLALPLKRALRRTPCPRQKELCRLALLQWGKNKALAMLCSNFDGQDERTE